MEIAAFNAATITYSRGNPDTANALLRTDTTTESGRAESQSMAGLQVESSVESASTAQSTAVALSSTADVRGYLATLQREPVKRVQEEEIDSRERRTEGSAPNAEATLGPDAAGESSSSYELTEEEQQEVQELQQRDREVRQHEQTHLAAAGSLATGGAQYQFQTGPDGKAYAIGGHVNIDTSPGSTPERTLEKAKQIQRAAMAPADPSPQDIKVAAKAMQMQMEALREIAEQAGESDERDQGLFSAASVEDVEATQNTVLSGVASLEIPVLNRN